jgi:NAD(P)-dependent dehydrogenase (short-subunit alcohol dehydrogenase family)
MTRYILISGASSGIGKAAAEALANQGFTVFAGALNESEAAMLRSNNVSGIIPVVLDVSSPTSIDTAMNFVRQTIESNEGGNGYLYGVLTCAGVDTNAPLQILDTNEITQMVNVNYLGTVLLTRAALGLMQHHQSRIVLISSAVGLLPSPLVSVYSSTKTAIEGFGDALRGELMSVGISLSMIEPGVIRTNMTKGSPAQLEKVLVRMSTELRSIYEAAMRKIVAISSDPKAGITTEHTSRAIIHAFTASRSARRYQVGADAKAARVISLLPHGVQDWIQRKVLGL